MSGANVSPIGRNKEKWFVPATDYRKLNEPLFLVSPYRAHIRSAHARPRQQRSLRFIFVGGAATPPLPRRGVDPLCSERHLWVTISFSKEGSFCSKTLQMSKFQSSRN